MVKTSDIGINRADAGASRRRSAEWLEDRDVFGFIHRAALRAEGLSDEAISDRPVIGICNSWSELVNCNLHLRGLATAVKRGILQAGGLPLEFPVVSLGENLMKPTTMLYRNLMAMDVEESIRAYPFDAVVLLAGCDKTIPAQLMGAASVDLPAIMMTGGPMQPGHFRGRRMGSGTDLWELTDDFRSGRMSVDEYAELEAAATPSVGHCSEMGTASTMASLVEALGMTLPGSAAIPAVDARRAAMAERIGRRAVEMADGGPRPSEIITAAAIDNAITMLAAIGGSTNAVIHLIALAGRVGIDLPLERFDAISARTPLIANVRPAGEYLYEDVFNAGGVPAILHELLPLLDANAMTVTGRPLGEEIAGREAFNRNVIATIDRPFKQSGGLVALRGSLAPDGAILKAGAATPELFHHRGPAVVFRDIHDLLARIDDPDLDVTADSVLILQNAGPKGGPGMPEWGMLPLPRKLLKQGVRDMVRISDARMSGTGYGTCILHVAPESAVGGPLGLVRDGDPIVLDVDARRLDLDIPMAELERRRAAVGSPAPPHYARGYGAIDLDEVLQANHGADFESLRAVPGAEPDRDPKGLLHGWITGW